MKGLRQLLGAGTAGVVLMLGSAAAAEERSASAEVRPHSDPARATDTVAAESPDPETEAPARDEPAPSNAAVAPSSSVKLSGRIWRAKSGFVFARTPVGTVTLFSETGLKTVKAGQRVTLWTHEANVVVDIFDHGDDVPVQRLITATPVSDSSDGARLTLWTPGGGVTIDRSRIQRRPSSSSTDPSVTVRLDRSGELVDFPQLNVDIQISNGTTKREDVHLHLAGTVSRVKAGFVFVETPVGILTLSRDTGVRDAEAGQHVAVWLTGRHLVIDLSDGGDPSPVQRVITSTVVYASREKNEIKVWTPEGEKVLPLPASGTQRRLLREGTPVTIQLNASGEVVDVRRAS